ncbi:methyltransferase domain-containing protein [Oceanicoccus sp. KOV_DT_Chl]|uniref:methyltransferase domain-containing protein n=1 Tax=Oceanicoccus sp. KOV_DT_Chl TaxID=1904639 RepID=UPI000C79735C|nr:methyltransferase domain-containing protein [Oceanicoccus sp. KOV_DT_Chl]
MNKRKSIQKKKKSAKSTKQYEIGNSLARSGDINGAMNAFTLAQKIDPENGLPYFGMANIYFANGKVSETLACLHKAMHFMPDHAQSYSLFSTVIESIQFDRYIPQLEEMYLQCFKTKYINHRPLAVGAVAQIIQKPGFRPVFDAMASASKEEELVRQIFESKKFGVVLSDPLFLSLIKSTAVPNRLLETVLTSLRRSLLLYVDDKGSADLADMTLFISALTEQNFINEYIYGESIREREALVRLEQKIKGGLSEGTVDWVVVALLASYQPLFKYDFSMELVKLLGADEEVHWVSLVKDQVLDPLEEIRIKQEIGALDDIDDEVTKAVKEQYEELPFPRWKTVTEYNQVSVKKFLKVHFPHVEIVGDVNVSKPSILIAGCGTGLQADLCEKRFNHSSITAIDLSASSLAYAVRKAGEEGNRAIEFINYNILELSKFNRQFDYVECFGVLHHVSDPDLGLQNLLSVVKPNGFLMLGLYSKFAREAVRDSWQFIKSEGFSSTLEGMRACREAVFSLDDQHPVKKISSPGSAFWSTSDVRDLIFHENEFQYDLLEVKALLEKYQLEFLGLLDVPPAKKAEYLRAFPSDPNATSLENWHHFEQRNPGMFGACYKFWVRKLV